MQLACSCGLSEATWCKALLAEFLWRYVVWWHNVLAERWERALTIVMRTDSGCQSMKSRRSNEKIQSITIKIEIEGRERRGSTWGGEGKSEGIRKWSWQQGVGERQTERERDRHKERDRKVKLDLSLYHVESQEGGESVLDLHAPQDVCLQCSASAYCIV